MFISQKSLLVLIVTVLTLCACQKMLQSQNMPQNSVVTIDQGRDPLLDPQTGTKDTNWVVRILINHHKTILACTGTLFKSDLILTAAHCLNNKIFGGMINVENLTIIATDRPSHQEYLYRAKSLSIHPNYVSNLEIDDLKKNDLALIALRDPVTPSISGQLPRLVLTRQELNSLKIPGGPFLFFGYGKTQGSTIPDHGLLFGQGIAQGPQQCLEKINYNKSGGTSPCPLYKDKGSVGYFCVLTGARGSGALNGDSGGPAVIHKNGLNHVIGVITSGDTEMKYEFAKNTVFETLDSSQTIQWMLKFMGDRPLVQ